jgi:hypothetical protein
VATATATRGGAGPGASVAGAPGALPPTIATRRARVSGSAAAAGVAAGAADPD